MELYAVLESEIFPEINRLNQLVAQNVIAASFSDDTTLIHDVSAMADVECFANVVVRDEHADTAFSQVVDNLFDIADGDGIDPCKRFVEQQKLRARSQGTSDLGSPPLTAAQRNAKTVPDVL